MGTQRFPVIDRRLLWEIGLPAGILWLVAIGQLLVARGDLSVFAFSRGGSHFQWTIYVTVCAVGMALLWLWLLQGTRCCVSVGPEGLGFEREGRREWLVAWKDFLEWDWERDLFGQPYQMVVYARLVQRRVRFGVLYAGYWRKGMLWPTADYRALLAAIARYVPTKGRGWAVTAGWS